MKSVSSEWRMAADSYISVYPMVISFIVSGKSKKIRPSDLSVAMELI
ncbi:hypothetical protein CFter6_1747 [Collimonas fungivorans]|uniref:Uncharacterized protein n=1 Tax=Collimonas fungivorans TaxID=158899 RepID=A0A127P9K9_9BURK|nr:hypothetical protein CFter6_1747 [Collimonas fungivorans]